MDAYLPIVTKRVLLFCSVFFIVQSLKAQTDLFLAPKTVQEVIQLEELLGSTVLETEKERPIPISFPGWSQEKTYQALTFSRNNDDFSPGLRVEYYYEANNPDSTIVCAYYHWDVYNEIDNVYDDLGKLEAQLIREEDYLKKYRDVKSLVASLVNKKGSSSKNLRTSTHNYTTKWSAKSTNIRLAMTFTTKLKSIRDMQLGTFRIRLHVVYNE